MERVSEVKIFAVLITSDLPITSHVVEVMRNCESSMWDLCILRINVGLLLVMHCLRYPTRPRSTISYMPFRHGGVAPVLRTGSQSTGFCINYNVMSSDRYSRH